MGNIKIKKSKNKIHCLKLLKKLQQKDIFIYISKPSALKIVFPEEATTQQTIFFFFNFSNQ